MTRSPRRTGVRRSRPRRRPVIGYVHLTAAQARNLRALAAKVQRYSVGGRWVRITASQMRAVREVARCRSTRASRRRRSR